jgi:thioredoxin-dependent peroxiredoxin
MRLKTGQPAPGFMLRDMYDRTVSLSQYWGRKVLLSFYRASVCPLCNLRLHYLIDRYDDYRRRGLEMIVFFESSPEMTRHYIERQRPPFPIIPDLGRLAYALYGMESSLFGAAKARLSRLSQYREAAHYHIGGNFWQNIIHMDGVFGRKPADFLLTADLRVDTAYYGRDAGDFMPFREIDRFLASRPESLWPYNQQPSQPGMAPPGYPSYPSYPSYPAPRGPASGYPGYSQPNRSGPGASGSSQPGRPGGYDRYPSSQSRPDHRRSGDSRDSGWDNSGW